MTLPEVPEGWTLENKQLERTFTFQNFTHAFAFMTRVAEIADDMNHHPDWSNSYNKVTIKLTTHDVGYVTGFDYEMAEKINQLLLQPDTNIISLVRKA